MRKNSEDESTIFELSYLINHSHFDFEVVEDSDQPESNLCHGEIKQCQFISMSRYQIPESWWKKTMSMMNYFQIPEPWWDRHNLQGSPPHQVAVQEGPHGGRRT